MTTLLDAIERPTEPSPKSYFSLPEGEARLACGEETMAKLAKLKQEFDDIRDLIPAGAPVPDVHIKGRGCYHGWLRNTLERRIGDQYSEELVVAHSARVALSKVVPELIRVEAEMRRLLAECDAVVAARVAELEPIPHKSEREQRQRHDLSMWLLAGH